MSRQQIAITLLLTLALAAGCDESSDDSDSLATDGGEAGGDGNGDGDGDGEGWAPDPAEDPQGFAEWLCTHYCGEEGEIVEETLPEDELGWCASALQEQCFEERIQLYDCVVSVGCSESNNGACDAYLDGLQTCLDSLG